MFRYVVIIGLSSLSYWTSAYETSTNSNHKVLKNDEEKYKFVFPLDAECAEKSGVTNEDFSQIDTAQDLLDILEGKRNNYTLCLGWKNKLLHPNGTMNQENFERAVVDFGYFNEPSFFTVTFRCFAMSEEFFPGVAAFHQSCACLLSQILYFNFSEEETKIFDELNHTGEDFVLPNKKAAMKTVDAFHGILLGKSAPESWVPNYA